MAELLVVRHMLDRARHKDAARSFTIRTAAGDVCGQLDPEVDSGCGVDIMTAAAAAMSGITWLYAPGVARLCLADGSAAKVPGITEKPQVVLREGTPHKRLTWSKALVIDPGTGADSHDLLLSKRWLAGHNLVLDSANSKLRYKSDSGQDSYMQLLGRTPSSTAAALEASICSLQGCSAELKLNSAAAQTPASVAVGGVSADSPAGLPQQVGPATRHVCGFGTGYPVPGVTGTCSSCVGYARPPQLHVPPSATRVCPGACSPRGRHNHGPMRLLVRSPEERAAMLAAQHSNLHAAAAVSATQPNAAVPDTSRDTDGSKAKHAGYYPGKSKPSHGFGTPGQHPSHAGPSSCH
jgi:hypothetical protein